MPARRLTAVLPARVPATIRGFERAGLPTSTAGGVRQTIHFICAEPAFGMKIDVRCGVTPSQWGSDTGVPIKVIAGSMRANGAVSRLGTRLPSDSENDDDMREITAGQAPHSSMQKSEDEFGNGHRLPLQQSDLKMVAGLSGDVAILTGESRLVSARLDPDGRVHCALNDVAADLCAAHEFRQDSNWASSRNRPVQPVPCNRVGAGGTVGLTANLRLQPCFAMRRLAPHWRIAIMLRRNRQAAIGLRLRQRQTARGESRCISP